MEVEPWGEGVDLAQKIVTKLQKICSIYTSNLVNNCLVKERLRLKSVSH